MKKTILLFFLLFFAIFTAEADQSIIRVRVESGKNKLLLNVKSPYAIKAINSGLVLKKGKRLRNVYIIPTNSGLKLGNKEFKVYGISIIPGRDATLYVGKSRFRGTLDIIRTEDLGLLVINHVDVEKYLYGVLYHEIPHYWPLECLKAQAVAARTFAFYRMGIMGDRDYDVTSDIYSQVYGGRSSERRSALKAVDATRGKVLTYRGEILPAYYHSTCGGHTENAKVVFEKDLPPLRGRRCAYDRGARGMNWKAMFSYRQMEKKLNDYGIPVKGMSYIVAKKRNKSGRIETIKIKDREGVKEIKAFKFRLALRPNVIRSTNFTVRITPKGVIFRGKGWGHGVGMCQWGAFGMSKRRFNYKEILEYYYPGAKCEAVRF